MHHSLLIQINNIDFKKGTKFTDSSADTKAYTAYDTKAKKNPMISIQVIY
jgi:hypothetical protein